MDVLLRTLKQIYVNASPVAVTLGTVPYNKSLSLIITHDIDYIKSIENAETYAAMEQQMGVRATYFIQTKYIRDWNDDIFFNSKTLPYLRKIQQAGMEIGSHSVAHSAVFSQLPLGTGNEKYPDYRPFVQDRTNVYNASILGELRVSKFLLESHFPGTVVTSFRPGHLEQPFTLPEALLAANYLYSSSVTANNVQTHLPYMAMYGRGFDSKTTIVELPITIEDEIGIPLLNRLDSALLVAEKLANYGGFMNVLIHTDATGQKLEFEKRLLIALQKKAWMSTINEFGKWWALRNELIITANETNGLEVSVTNPSPAAIDGVCLLLPRRWQLSNAKDAYQEDRAVIIMRIAAHSTKVLRFKTQP
jgi:hypothetical protein